MPCVGRSCYGDVTGYPSRLDDAPQFLRQERLGQDPRGSGFQKFVRLGAHHITGDKDDSLAQSGVRRVKLLVQTDPVKDWHDNIAEDYVERLLTKLGACNPPVLGCLDLVTIGPEHVGHRGGDGGIIVNHENPFRHVQLTRSRPWLWPY